MFIGHFGVALAAKKISPKISLGVLFAAGQLLDLIWPIAVFLGLETAAHNHSLHTFNSLDLISVPYSHSLGMAFIWSILFGVLMKVMGHPVKTAVVIAFVVFSHWILDFVTHVPDLPLWFGENKVGLGLWTNVWATYITETLIFGFGIAFYLKAFPKIQKKNQLLFWSMIFFLFAFYTMHVFGPKPPETQSSYKVAAPAFALWLIVLWAYSADKKIQNNTY